MKATAPVRQIITARRFLDVDAGVIREHPVITTVGDRIESVRFGKPPRSRATLDLGNVTLMPGLIDCHTHLMGSAKPGDNGYAHMLLTQSQATRALEGARAALLTLRAGFTSVRDCENEGSGYADVALRDAVRDGVVPGPRMWISTRGIAAVGQYHPFNISPDLPTFPHGAQMVSGVEEARRAAREQIGHGADFIKVYADWRRPTLTREEIAVVVEEAHRQGLKVAAHATTPEGIRNAVLAGVSSIEHGTNADWASLQLMRTHDVWLVPTIAAVTAALSPERLERARKVLRMARENGVDIASGYDAGDSADQGKNAHELSALVKAGLTPIEAIRAATRDAGRLIGQSGQIGAVTPGAFADIIGVEGDPLADIAALQKVAVVIKGGSMVKPQAG